MEVHIAPDKQAIIESLVTSGRFQSVDDVVAEGVRLLATTENLRQKVQVGIEQAERGEDDESAGGFGSRGCRGGGCGRWRAGSRGTREGPAAW